MLVNELINTDKYNICFVVIFNDSSGYLKKAKAKRKAKSFDYLRLPYLCKYVAYFLDTLTITIKLRECKYIYCAIS